MFVPYQTLLGSLTAVVRTCDFQLRRLVPYHLYAKEAVIARDGRNTTNSDSLNFHSVNNVTLRVVRKMLFVILSIGSR